MDFLKILEDSLLKDSRFVAEDGRVLKAKVYDAAMAMDHSLLDTLLSEPKLKEHFFKTVKDILVFDKVQFAWVLNSHEFLPDSYTMYKNKIGLTDGGESLISQKNDISLIWPYKDCVLEGGQTKEDEKRNEVFYNETLAPDQVTRLLYPKVFCNAKRYSCVDEFDSSDQHARDEDAAISCEQIRDLQDDDNLIIKGNNLLAISSLLKRYEGEVKCVYIDPPYYFDERKEADSFKYNSNFSLSTWLVFMKNRLDISKKLLARGGTIWISISEDGMHYLKVLADSIFGKDHFVGTIPRRTRNGKSDVPFNLSQDFDWLLCYTNVDDTNAPIGRQVERKYYETDDHPGQPWRLADLTKQTTASERANSFFTMVNPKNGKEYPASTKRTWCITQDTFDHYYQKGAIVFPGDYDFLNIGKPYMRKFKSEDDSAGKLSAVISDFQIQEFLQTLLGDAKNKDGNNEIDVMFGREEFGYAKPESLVKAIIEVSTKKGDTVLDFHLGSGTTAAVAHKMGRHYIGVEQMEYINTVTLSRLQKVIQGEGGGISKDVNWHGGGSFVYCELAERSEALIAQLEMASDSDAIFSVLDQATEQGLLRPSVLPSDLKKTREDLLELSLDEQKRLVTELLDKNKLYVNLCDIDDDNMNIKDTDKAFTQSFYRMNKEVED